jgi:hypothetical protein
MTDPFVEEIGLPEQFVDVNQLTCRPGFPAEATAPGMRTFIAAT